MAGARHRTDSNMALQFRQGHRRLRHWVGIWAGFGLSINQETGTRNGTHSGRRINVLTTQLPHWS